MLHEEEGFHDRSIARLLLGRTEPKDTSEQRKNGEKESETPEIAGGIDGHMFTRVAPKPQRPSCHYINTAMAFRSECSSHKIRQLFIFHESNTDPERCSQQLHYGLAAPIYDSS
jgi:hypothetical protein